MQYTISLLITLDDKSESLECEKLESSLVLNQSVAICIRKRPKSYPDLPFYYWNCQPVSASFTTMNLLALQ